MSEAYVPPSRRASRLQRAPSRGPSALGIKWKPKFDLEKEASSFPALSGDSPARSGNSPVPGQELATFLCKAAARTEKLRRRNKPKKPKCVVGWVTLPQVQPTVEAPAASTPRPYEYGDAAWRILGRIQRCRDVENEVLGPHSQWADELDVRDPRNDLDNSDLEDWWSSEDETGSESE